MRLTRNLRRPVPRAIEWPRILAMLGMLVVLGLLIQRSADPRNWSWLAPLHAEREADAPAGSKASLPADKPAAPAWAETVVPGPTDEDADERTALQHQASQITDKQPMSAEEMPAYWHLLRWSRAQTARDLHRRARKGVLFTQFWQDPAHFRGEVVELRLHLRRALVHDAPQNAAGFKHVYEAWGPTDESMSHPYVIVCPEFPPGVSTGNDVRCTATFVGYFFKILGYEAHDAQRGAPMLIGRLRPMAVAPAAAVTTRHETGGGLPLLGGAFALAAAGIAGWRMLARRRQRAVEPPSEESLLVEEWLAHPLPAARNEERAPCTCAADSASDLLLEENPATLPDLGVAL